MHFRDKAPPAELRVTSLRRQDLLCLFLYYLGFSRIKNLAFRFSNIPVARILAFHDVPDHLTANFHSKIKTLKRQANIISLDDFYAGRLLRGRINIAVTFDDGYRSWLDNVAPVLRDLRVSATFFTSSGFVGLREDEGVDFLRENLKSNRLTTGSLSVEGLRKLAEQGFAIGGHTSSHVNLTKVSDVNELCREIKKDMHELERMAGTTVKYFAYPFGLHRHPLIDLGQVLQESGYRGAVTTVPGFNTTKTNGFFLRRDLVDASLPLSVFKARFHGNYDGVRFVRDLLGLRVALDES